MKRRILLFLVSLLLVLVPVFSGEIRIIGSVSPYFITDTFPLMKETKGGLCELRRTEGSYETVQDSILRFFSRPALGALGAELENGNVRAVILAEAREELGSFINVHPLSNIPYLGGSERCVTDAQWPQVAYAEYGTDELLVSVGRRSILWGPGKYGFIFSSTFPLENISLVYTPLLSSHFSYSFTALSGSTSSLNAPGAATETGKSFFAHSFSWGLDSFRLTFSEINCVYGAVPSIMDWSPFILWHNIYQEEHSNVMVEASVEAALGSVRLYGSFAVDDINLPSEGNNHKPTALGILLGLDVAAGERGKGFDLPSTDRRRFVLSSATLAIPSSLHFGAEWYLSSAFLYNRRSSSPDGSFLMDGYGKFTLPRRFYSSYGGMTDAPDAFFLGFPYGPGTSLLRLYSTYGEERGSVSVALSWMRRCEVDIESVVDGSSQGKWLCGDGWDDNILSLSFEGLLNAFSIPSLTLSAKVEAQYSTKYLAAYLSAALGAVYSFGL